MCACGDLPDLIEVAAQQPHFEADLDVLDQGNQVTLLRCRRCRQLWRMDVPDRLQVRFAAKLTERDGWERFDTVPREKRFLLASRGGLQASGECVRAGCANRPVRGVAYCVDHLHAIGWRK